MTFSIIKAAEISLAKKMKKVIIDILQTKLKKRIGYEDDSSELERFEKKFPDPMTKKYGKGIKLYCSFCAGQEPIKEFLKNSLTCLANWMKECVPEEKTIDKKFSTDEQRYPQGLNSCRKQILENYEKRID